MEGGGGRSKQNRSSAQRNRQALTLRFPSTQPSTHFATPRFHCSLRGRSLVTKLEIVDLMNGGSIPPDRRKLPLSSFKLGAHLVNYKRFAPPLHNNVANVSKLKCF